MASGPVLALLLAILATGTALLVWGLVAVAQWIRLQRRTRRAPTDGREGVATLQGTCRPTRQEDVIRSPVSGREALWSEVTLQRDEGRPVRPQWTDVGHERDMGSFDLVAGDDTVRVDPSAATVDVEPATILEFDATPEDLEDLRSSLDSISVETAGGTLQVGTWDLPTGEYYRLVERRLEPGASVSVTGRIVPPDGEGLTARIDGPTPTSLLRRLVSVPFVIADATGDSGPKRLRNRALVGLVFGLPLALLAIVYLFPPGT